MTQTAVVLRRPDPIAPARLKVVRAVMRSEWTKLCTVRSTVWALVFTVVSMVGIAALLTGLEASRWDHRSAQEVLRFDPLLYCFGGVNLAQLSVGVLGVLVMTSEYATGLIKLTFSATPQRTLLLTAKVATFSAVVAIVSVGSCFAAFFIGQSFLARRDANVSITDPHVLRAVLGAALYLVVVGAIGVGLGAILRHTAGAVAVLFAVLLVIPGLVSLLPAPWNDTVIKYLPGSAGASMAATIRVPTQLSPGIGFAVLMAYTAATLVAAGLVLCRRDA